MKMLPYSFAAGWVPGKKHLVADALSRSRIDHPSLDHELCESHSEAAVKAYFADAVPQDLQILDVLQAETTDPQMSIVRNYVSTGWPPIGLPFQFPSKEGFGKPS